MNTKPTSASTCPDDATLQKVCLGNATHELTEQVLAHVEDCPSCPARIDVWWNQSFGNSSTAQNRSLPNQRRGEVRASGNPLASLLARTGVVGDLGFLQPSPFPDMLGRLGPYDLVRLIGSGGVGLVFEAVDSRTGATVALKCLRPDRAISLDMQERFLREAATPAAIGHVGVPPVLDQGVDGEIPYLVMPLLKGFDFRKMIRDRAPLPPEEVVKILVQVAGILKAAHVKGIIHRDIKPSNLWLQSDPGGDHQALLLDFGLATFSQGPVQLTQTGDMIGTPAYFSPEQADGFAKGVTPATDLFSLGAVAYELLTGRRVFPGETPLEILRNMAHFRFSSPKRLIPAIPQPLSDLVMRLLSLAPNQRPSSSKLLAELRSPSLLKDPWITRRKLMGLGVGIGSVVVLGGLMEVTRRQLAKKVGPDLRYLSPTRTFQLPGASTFDFNKLGDFNTEPNTVYWATSSGEFGTLPVEKGTPVTVGKFEIRPTDLRAGIRNLVVCDASGRFQCHDKNAGTTTPIIASPFKAEAAETPGPFMLWSGNFGRFLIARGNQIGLLQINGMNASIALFPQEFGGDTHISSLLHYPPGVESLRPFGATIANGWMASFGMPHVQGYDLNLLTEGVDYRMAFDPTGAFLAVWQMDGTVKIANRLAELTDATAYQQFQVPPPEGTTGLITPVDLQFSRKRDLIALLGLWNQKGTLDLYSRAADRIVARVAVEDPVEMEIRGGDLWVLDRQSRLHHFDQFEGQI